MGVALFRGVDALRPLHHPGPSPREYGVQLLPRVGGRAVGTVGEGDVTEKGASRGQTRSEQNRRRRGHHRANDHAKEQDIRKRGSRHAGVAA